MSKPDFADDMLISWYDYKTIYVDPFLIHIYCSANQSVDLSRCLGTNHTSYINNSWHSLYTQKLKRREMNLQKLQNNPSYYYSVATKDCFSFYMHNNKYFIAQGNHRAVIGRCYLHSQGSQEMIHGVCVCRYVTDDNVANLYRILRNVEENVGVNILRKDITINNIFGAVILLLSNMHSPFNILIDTSYAKLLLHLSIHARRNTEEYIIILWIIKVLTLPPILQIVFFYFLHMFCSLKQDTTINLASYRIRQPQTVNTDKKNYNIRDIANCILIRKVVRIYLNIKSLKYR